MGYYCATVTIFGGNPVLSVELGNVWHGTYD